MSDLIRFLLARIAEVEAAAQRAISSGRSWASVDYYDGALADHGGYHSPAHVLAECKAKRRIMEIAEDQIRLGNQARGWDNWRDMAQQNLRVLASPYADHPDYRAEWADQ